MSASPEAPARTLHPTRAGRGPLVQYVTGRLLSAGVAAALPVAFIGIITDRFTLVAGGVAIFALSAVRWFLNPWGHVPEGEPTDTGPAWQWGLVMLPAVTFAAAGVTSAALLPADPYFMYLSLVGGVTAAWKVSTVLSETVIRHPSDTELVDLCPTESAEWKTEQLAVAGAALVWVALGAAMAPDAMASHSGAQSSPTIALGGAGLGAAITLTAALVCVAIEKCLQFATARRARHGLT